MISMTRGRLPLTAAAALTATAVGASAAVAAATTPAKDTFSGQIVSATGKLSKDRGHVTILIHITQSSHAARPVQLTLASPSCGQQPHCLRLSGSLSGTITARASIPDTGRRYNLQTSGHVSPLGHVSATGQVDAVGFIRQGHEGLRLTMQAPAGQLTISAVSPKVPGFTSP